MIRKGERIFLDADEAISVLPDQHNIHTFYNHPISLIGADWDKDEVIDKLRAADIIEVTGEAAQAMKHGICVYNKDAKLHSDILFIETDEAKIKRFTEPLEGVI